MAWSPCPLFEDDFNGARDPNWNVTMPPEVSVGNGQLVLNMSAATDGNVRAWLPVAPQGMVGGTATLALGEAPTLNTITYGIRVETPDVDLLMFRVHRYESGTVMLEVWQSPMNSAPQIVAADDFSPVEHQWLRMSEQNGMLLFETSEDGADFDFFFETPNPFAMDDAEVGISAGNYEPLMFPEPVSFERFSFECPR